MRTRGKGEREQRGRVPMYVKPRSDRMQGGKKGRNPAYSFVLKIRWRRSACVMTGVTVNPSAGGCGGTGIGSTGEAAAEEPRRNSSGVCALKSPDLRNVTGEPMCTVIAPYPTRPRVGVATGSFGSPSGTVWVAAIAVTAAAVAGRS